MDKKKTIKLWSFTLETKFGQKGPRVGYGRQGWGHVISILYPCGYFPFYPHLQGRIGFNTANPSFSTGGEEKEEEVIAAHEWASKVL